MRSLRSPDTEARFGRGELDAAFEDDTRPRIVPEQEVPVEIDVGEETRDVRSGSDSEAGLDHAAEHDPEPESPRRVNHTDGLAHPAGLRQLDVDAVRALGARGDVDERMAVLVDVD